MKENEPEKIDTVKHAGIYLAFPAYGGKIDAPFAVSIYGAMNIEGMIAHMDILNGDSLVSRARNKLCMNFLHGFMAKDTAGKTIRILCDWLLFIDTDLIFSPNDVRMLYELALKRGPNVYAGTYPIKQLRPKIVFNQMEGCRPDEEGVVEVRETGTGFMLIHRSVLEKMIEKFSDEIRYEADAGSRSVARSIEYDFFSVGVRVDPVYKYKRYLSEDWFFCQRWREIGGKVLLHTRIQCQHIGQIVYPVPTKDILEVAKIHTDALQALKEHEEKSKQQPVSVAPPPSFTPKAQQEQVPVAASA